ncbi:MAG: phytanoyl-CoA dioxygenase family protein [Armatimonadetes bacterium]|nr:phytanoyl-CoA dioxygenase family protein [Armatimonadota bacterium]MDE2205644.1 phytanoyl-CoA dioxygenase family protein [Armatimonadota bacterium]
MQPPYPPTNPEEAPMLPETNTRFFDTFGYIGLPGLMADCINEIEEAFEEIWSQRGGGHNGSAHSGAARSCIVPFLDQHERLCALLDDHRILAICNSLLGADFNYMGSDGNYYTGDTSWHSDGWYSEMRYLKIAFYLDDLTRETGCLRVIPGSHIKGDRYADALHRDIGRSQELLGIAGSELPAVALETRPGDVVCFHHNTKHSSFGGSTSRRMFTINLSQHYPDALLPELRNYVASFARFWVDCPFGDEMLRTAGPTRRRHLEQVLANSDHLPALAREARERMSEPSRG